jgi:hypothetical protein
MRMMLGRGNPQHGMASEPPTRGGANIFHIPKVLVFGTDEGLNL